MKHRSLFAGLAVLVVGAGCAQFHDASDDLLTSLHDRYLAHKSWRSMREFCDEYGASESHFGAATRYAAKGNRKHMGRGYRAGYRAVAAGGDGVPPIFPPRRYWHVWYRNPRGHRVVESWFYGYNLGAAVAEQDGVGQWHDLPLLLPTVDDGEHLTPETFLQADDVIDAENPYESLPGEPHLHGNEFIFDQDAEIEPWNAAPPRTPPAQGAPPAEAIGAPQESPLGVPITFSPLGLPTDSSLPSESRWHTSSSYPQ